MNNRIAVAACAVNFLSVAAFALSMLLRWNNVSYFVSILIALSFVVMTAAFCGECRRDQRAAGYASMLFAGIYAAIILLVYFAQLTAVRLDGLNAQASQILDYQSFGLFFSYDLLGYGMMALSTFFAGLTLQPAARADRWLRGLLLIHGIFFFSCLTVPMLGLFSPGGPDWVGVAVLEFWCLYFIPIGVLSLLHFRRSQKP